MFIPFFAFTATVNVQTLIAEMADLDHLMFPAAYSAAQSSSYDRASKSPSQDWFANADAGKFLRAEGKEMVMADLQGPGAVVRIWSANPTGTLRMYFDGEAIPRLEAPMGDLLRGKFSPFSSQFAYEASRGCNLYFPFPYAKSLKITVEGNVGGLYYHVNHRTYVPGTDVLTYAEQRQAELPLLVWQRPTNPSWTRSKASANVGHSGKVSLNVSGPSVVRQLQVKLGKLDGVTLRSLALTMTVDGERTIVSPLGDFFCTTAGVSPYDSVPMRVQGDGTLTCRFPMPVGKKATIEIVNRTRGSVPIDMVALVEPTRDVPPYRFHAQWSYDRGRTRPMRDLHVADLVGSGRYVGTALHIENPTPAWWGEGDEKVYVDGESFPSTFGTGTEDYFGYAWSSPEKFEKPYHGQSRCDGPGTFGHSTVYRWQTFDDLPYTKSLKFDLEMWHWSDVIATWDRVAYWYAMPGGKGNHDYKLELPVKLEAPKPVEGAIEGENLKVVATGGTHEVQDGFWDISGQKQRWWMDAKAGDTLTFELSIPNSGTYEVTANMCHAKDYGIHEIKLDGKSLKTIDFYSDGLSWSKTTLGRVALKQGTAKLEIVCRGHNSKAIPRNMFGLDYVLLKKR